jgi:hypothetical protein
VSSPHVLGPRIGDHPTHQRRIGATETTPQQLVAYVVSAVRWLDEQRP